jgi:hypothetical protein
MAEEGFDAFDQDGDGSISVADLIRTVSELGNLGIPELECHDLHSELRGGVASENGISRDRWLQALALANADKVVSHLGVCMRARECMCV